MSIQKKIFLLFLTIIVIAFIGVFARNILSTENTPSGISEDNEKSFVQRITVQEKYENGKIVLFGAITTQSPCSIVSTSSNQIEDNVYEITIETDQPSIGCENIMTDQILEYTFEAPKNAILQGTYNGIPVEFNRIKLDANQEFSNPIEYTKG